MNISLNRIHLRNFRGYIDTVINFDEHINVIVGKNDVGKSTVLEALEIFFNNSRSKLNWKIETCDAHKMKRLKSLVVSV